MCVGRLAVTRLVDVCTDVRRPRLDSRAAELYSVQGSRCPCADEKGGSDWSGGDVALRPTNRSSAPGATPGRLVFTYETDPNTVRARHTDGISRNPAMVVRHFRTLTPSRVPG